ncbi:TadE family protein [Labrenzia sp. CE80]|uniref:TadE family protein n=1 Tax=Labrenzia sp. CE80 TaxID=1788986 RepID=UPI0013899982|nr:TadE family protein [Labrenzia sp. CE80]
MTAIEFAIIAPVFFMILFSTFEAGLLFTRLAMLDNAVSILAKSIYIGELADGIDDGTTSQDDVEKMVCAELYIVMPDCDENITVELTEVTSLYSLPTTDAECIDSMDLEINPAVTFDPGGSGSNVFMRVCTTVDVLTPGLGLGLALTKTSTDRFELISSTAFRNEPY